jgi:hypothetical protein
MTSTSYAHLKELSRIKVDKAAQRSVDVTNGPDA